MLVSGMPHIGICIHWKMITGSSQCTSPEHLSHASNHVSVWQKPLQYCKVISLQLIKTNGEKNDNCKSRYHLFPYKVITVIIYHIPYSVYDILMAYLFYNWRLIYLNLVHLFCTTRITCLFTVSLSTLILFCFLDSTCKLDHSLCLSLS